MFFCLFLVFVCVQTLHPHVPHTPHTHFYTHNTHKKKKQSVLYSSATGASEPLNLAYMLRLLPPGFKNPFDMVKALSTAGLGSLELFCMGLKVIVMIVLFLCFLCL